MSRRPLRCLAILAVLFGVVYASAIEIYQTQDKQNFYWMFWEDDGSRFFTADGGRALAYSVRVDTAGNGSDLQPRAADSSWTQPKPKWDTYIIYFYDNTPRTVMLVDSAFVVAPLVPPGAFSPDSTYTFANYLLTAALPDSAAAMELIHTGLDDGAFRELDGAAPIYLSTESGYLVVNFGWETEGGGEIIYYNAGWQNLAAGANEKILKLKSGLPSWETDDDVPDAGDFGTATDLDANGALNTGCVADNEIDYANVTLADFDYQTAWRVFYSDTNGDITELALGADGTYLKSNGAAVAPTFATPGGGGDMMVADFGDSLVNYDGDGIKITDLDDIDVLVDFDGGIETADDSLNVKLHGATLTLSASGLKVTDATYLLLTSWPDSVAVTASTELSDTADLLYESELDAFSELQTQIGDKTLVNEEDVCTIDANWVNTANPWAVNEVHGDLLTATEGNAAYLALAAFADSFDVHMDAEVDTVTKEMLIWAPDGINDEIEFFKVDALFYPNGITLIQLSISLPADAAYSMVFEEWAGDPPVAQNDVETVTTGGTDAYMEVAEADIDDKDLDADDMLYLHVPATDVDWIKAMAIFIKD